MIKNIWAILCLSIMMVSQLMGQIQGTSPSPDSSNSSTHLQPGWFGAGNFCISPSDSTFPRSPQASSIYPPRPAKIPAVVGCDSPALTTIRVNIHWVLKSDGTGNFTETGDNVVQGGNINGYNRAEMLIDRLNRHWEVNATMALFNPPGPPPVWDTRIRFVLAGVHFIRDDDYYQNGVKNGISDWSIAGQYGINLWSEINIFMTERPASSGISGIANQIGNVNLNIPLVTKVYNEWSRYRNSYFAGGDGAPSPFYTGGNDGTLHGGTIMSKIISHEIGHLLRLNHANTNDGCTDTPPHSNNCWSCPSNNVMDYSKHIPYAFTPCQIETMHDVLDGDARLYIEECGDCIPARAFFTSAASVCMDLPNPDLVIDAHGSYNEDKHVVWVHEVANVGDWQSTGPVWKGVGNSGNWTPGEAGEIDIRTIPPSSADIQPNKIYRVLLAVQNYDENGAHCTDWDQYVRWIQTYTCQVAPPTKPKRQANDDKYALKIFPNPTHNLLTLSYDLGAHTSAAVSLYNLAGQVIYTENVDPMRDKLQMYLGHLPSGTYLLRLTADGRAIAHEKLIISK